MYCFNMFAEVLFPVDEERSMVESSTRLKSPPTIIFEEEPDSIEKREWKKDGQSELGPYILASVNVSLPIEPITIMYRPSWSTIVDL